jgi:hypothetical protein
MLLFQACYLSFFPQGTPADVDFNQPIDKAPQAAPAT